MCVCVFVCLSLSVFVCISVVRVINIIAVTTHARFGQGWKALGVIHDHVQLHVSQQPTTIISSVAVPVFNTLANLTVVCVTHTGQTL